MIDSYLKVLISTGTADFVAFVRLKSLEDGCKLRCGKFHVDDHSDDGVGGVYFKDEDRLLGYLRIEDICVKLGQAAAKYRVDSATTYRFVPLGA